MYCSTVIVPSYSHSNAMLFLLTFVFLWFVLLAAPRWLSRGRELPEPEVSDGQPDDGGLVQLRRDGSGKRKHLSQLVELKVLLPATRPSGVARLLLA